MCSLELHKFGLESLHLQYNCISIRVLCMLDCCVSVKKQCKTATFTVDCIFFSSDVGQSAFAHTYACSAISMQFEVVIL